MRVDVDTQLITGFTRENTLSLTDIGGYKEVYPPEAYLVYVPQNLWYCSLNS